MAKKDDANVLAWVIELILKENPDADIEGIVHISWDDDDSMTKLVVHDSYVLESYRLNVFSEPNSVTAWKPEKVDNATN